MIKFNIQKDDLAYIFNALRPALAKADAKPVFQYIKFECKAGKLTASALDGYRLHTVTVSVDVEGENKDFTFLLKPFSIPKIKSSLLPIPCELSEKEIMFDFGDRKYIERLGNGVNSFINVSEVMPKTPSVFKIGFQPQFLAEAAKSLQTKGYIKDALVMEFFGPLQPAVLYNSRHREDFRLILPVRLRGDEDA